MSSNPHHNHQEFLKQVIDLAFQYLERHSSRPNTEEFAGFLARYEVAEKKEDHMSPDPYGVSAADDLGRRLVLLNRYAKEYVKVALADTELGTADEFPFLMALFVGGSHTKTELFDKMLLTKTTGSEILKRLKRRGLIVENPDTQDKRSKRVDISEQGKKLVLTLLPRMSGVSQLISGNLSTAELGRLNHLLKILCDHHRQFFADTSDEELQSIIRK